MGTRLSIDMRRGLLDLIRGKKEQISQSTLGALIARDLVDHNAMLTRLGRVTSISLLPLAEQCRQLGISLEYFGCSRTGHSPERDVWVHLCSLGFRGSYCEGGPILLLIRAAALDTLTRLNPFNSREDACNRFTEAQLTIHKSNADLILDAIRTVDNGRVIDNFVEIYQSPFVRGHYPGLDPDCIAFLFDALGAEKLTQITAAMMRDPYRYRAGWPDLIMATCRSMLWAEVKTTDKLHESQIWTITHMKHLLPGEIKVIQVDK